MAQGNSFEGMPITSVSYRPPLRALDPADLMQLEVFKVGAPFHAGDAAETVDRLFATGRFRDVQIDANPAGGGVAVSILTVDNWFVGHITLEGKVKKPPSREDLADAARLGLGTPFRQEDVTTAQRNLQGLFERNGLYENTIEVKTEDKPEIQQRNVTFAVKL